MANPKDPAKPVARSPGFWENLMSPKPKGPATSLRNATHMTQQVVPTAAAAADAALNASTSARHGGRAQLPDEPPAAQINFPSPAPPSGTNASTTALSSASALASASAPDPSSSDSAVGPDDSNFPYSSLKEDRLRGTS